MKDAEEAGCKRNVTIPSKDSADISAENFRNIKIYSHLNFLLVGLTNGEIQIHVFGLFCCGVIDIKQHFGSNVECTILAADITQNLKSLIVVVNTKIHEETILQCIVIDTSQLSDRSQDLYTISYIRGSILNTINNISRSMVSITEAHEHIVIQEMQMQIFEYSKGKEEGTLSTEFMELLLFGFYSAELSKFLLSELSDKKLKKISTSIEVSHSNILKHVTYHLGPDIEKLLYELSILLSLSKLSVIFSESKIIIEEQLVMKCMMAACAFRVKTNKVLNILDTSTIKYKAFFRWLLSAAAIVSNERTGNSVFEVNQRELNFISDYLCEIDSSTPIFEKDELGQFLADKDICIKNDIEDKTLWRKFLIDNPCVEDCELVISRFFDSKTLVQTHKYLVESVELVFRSFTQYIKKDFPITFQSKLFFSQVDFIRKVSIIEVPKSAKILIAYIKPYNGDKVLEVVEISQKSSAPSTKTASIYFEENKHGKFNLIDLQFYTHEVVSILLDRNDCLHSFCIQLPVDSVQYFYNKPEPQNVFTIIDKDCLKVIENMKSLKFAVSGPRKVSVIVAEDGHRVRIFEMEADDEEENAMSTNNLSSEEPSTSSKLVNNEFSEDDFVNTTFESDTKADTSGTNIADDSKERIHLENSIIDFAGIDVNTLTMLPNFTDIDDLMADIDLERDIANLAIANTDYSQSASSNAKNLHSKF